jgi:hypothetical protein
MIARALTWGTLAFALALGACRDRDREEYSTTPPRPAVAPPADQPGTLSDRTGAPTGDLRQDTMPGEGTVAGQPSTGVGRPAYRATLKGSKATGTARFERGEEESGLTKVMIDVRDAPKGTYQVHVFDGTDCEAISTMETPYAGGPGVAGEGKKGSPGPATTLAIWKSLGTMTVDETGKGKIAVDMKGAEGERLDKRMVVIYSESKEGAKQQAVIACGPVSAGESGEGAG